MRVKIFEGKTEEEALQKARATLGSNVIVLNTKKYTKKSFLPMFNSSRVEITAAVDVNNNMGNSEPSLINNQKISIGQSNAELELRNKDEKIKNFEQEIRILNEKISKSDELIGTLTKDILEVSTGANRSILYKNNSLQKYYLKMINADVLEEVAKELIGELESSDESLLTDEYVFNYLKNRIIESIGEPSPINAFDNKKKVIFFIGSTGVGKTTTIAKITSRFVLENNLSVGLITADTYRIAAVEQLKVYADILGTEVKVVYNNNDMQLAVNKMTPNKDIVFIDTAGRSHKNVENMSELFELIKATENNECYVVLSLATKTEDLLSIVNVYGLRLDFKIIFTKEDETLTLGNILNVCYKCKAKVSYITNGQSVPNDIKVISPERVAELILS